MKFTLNTKPLKDSMNLGIISSNISKFFEKSTVIELTAVDDTLRINTQATSLLSESYIKGYNEGEDTGNAIVDCNLFKSLIGTIDSSEISLTFDENVLVVQSGKSRFNVPKLLNDEDGISLDRPESEDIESKFVGELHPSTWKYIQDHQLYAVADSQIQKAYTRVWVSTDRGVLTGDPTMSYFTYQPTSDLSSNCLISSTIVNLLAMLDEGSKLYQVDNSNYVVVADHDSFKFISEFTVEHEDENGIGSYGSDMIFDMILDESQKSVQISTSKLVGSIKQASLFATASDPLIYLESNDKGVRLVNDNVNCRISSDSYMEYNIAFTVNDLDTVVNHMDGDTLDMSPIVKEGDVVGIRFKSGDMIAVLGGVE